MRSLALICLVGMTGCEASPQYDHVHAATLTLRIGDSGCSGTAVGRFTVLSASHCFDKDTREIQANGRACKVWKIVNDGNDHALLTVSCEFKAWATLTRAAKAGREPRVGSAIFVWGNPYLFSDVLRFGNVAGHQANAMPGMGRALLHNFNGWAGDSGAAIFNSRGNIVAVVSIGSQPYRLMGSFPLAFSTAQLQAAGL